MSDHAFNVYSCPACGETARAETLETRRIAFGGADGLLTNFRRKRCPSCGHRYKTVEVPFHIGRELFQEE